MTIQHHLQSAAVTRGGLMRDHNEDAVFHVSYTHPAGSDAGLYIVSDGLGGHEAGERASNMVIETVEESLFSSFLTLSTNDEQARWPQQAHEAVSMANRNVYQAAQDEACNMGATIALAIVVSGSAYIAAVGDSRVYIWRRGELERITEDHSIAAELARINQIDDAEIAGHPRSNVLSRALGQKESVEVDLFRQTLADGDRLLLCSDGLWKAFPEPGELADILGRPVAPLKICEQLVKMAIARDGTDDTSAIVVQVRAVETPLWKEKVSSLVAINEREAELVPA